MKEEGNKKVKLLTVFLILAIIIILVMAYYKYKANNEKTNETLEFSNDNLTTEQISDNINSELNNNANSISNNNSANITSNTKEVVSNNETTNTGKTSKTGKYNINGMTITPDPENYGIESIDLKGNNQFSVNMPLGTSYTGTYSIEGENLVCKATKENNSEGGETSKSANITFTFQILDNSKIKFINVTKSDFELTIGMIYSIN